MVYVWYTTHVFANFARHISAVISAPAYGTGLGLVNQE